MADGNDCRCVMVSCLFIPFIFFIKKNLINLEFSVCTNNFVNSKVSKTYRIKLFFNN